MWPVTRILSYKSKKLQQWSALLFHEKIGSLASIIVWQNKSSNFCIKINETIIDDKKEAKNFQIFIVSKT